SDQSSIPHPRLGFFGVIDERFDIELLEQVAAARPDWNFVIIGPIVKIDPESLPKHSNIHYLGPKKYDELPDYLAGWDIALLLFARNESTRFISPTKTPEYLAAGKPVISTSIKDVIRPYGELNLVEIADTADKFIEAAENILSSSASSRSEWLGRVDKFLADVSWDKTWAQMSELIDSVIESRRPVRSASMPLNKVSTRANAAVSP
ncbi:MAG TPA: glycosyltransferase, partial [Pyrinomonadaceae bacterium]